MKVGIVTGVYGSYDPIRDLPENHGFDDAVIVTDDPNVGGIGWRTLVVPQPGRQFMNGMLQYHDHERSD